jgi:hypothetical protein
MANITVFINLYRDTIVNMSEFQAVGLTKKDINARYEPQTKDRNPTEYPAIALYYDFNQRERWAPIDNLNLFIKISMKQFEQVRTLAEAIRNKFHMFMDGSTCVTVYKSFLNGGDPQPIFNDKLNAWEVILEFEIAIG